MRVVLSICLLSLVLASAAAQETERAVLTMSIGDSLVVVDSLVRTDARIVSRVTNFHRARFLIEADTLPSVSPSLALVEQQIRRARRRVEGNGSTTIPMWTPYGGDGKGRTWTDTVTFVAPDSVEISGWEDAVSTYRIDEGGRILSGRIEPAGYTIERTPASE